jgi:hypothetical protein
MSPDRRRLLTVTQRILFEPREQYCSGVTNQFRQRPSAEVVGARLWAVGVAVRPVGAGGVTPGGTGQRGTSQRGPGQVVNVHPGVREVCVSQIGIGEVVTIEKGTFQIGIAQVARSGTVSCGAPDKLPLPQITGLGGTNQPPTRPCGSDPPKVMLGATWLLTRR